MHSAVQVDSTTALANAIKRLVFSRQASRHGREIWDPCEVIDALADVVGYFSAQIEAGTSGIIDARRRFNNLAETVFREELDRLNSLSPVTH